MSDLRTQLRITAALVLLVLIALAAPASARPYHPRPFYRDKQFWAGLVVIGAATTLDVVSTTNGNYPGFGDSSLFLFGKAPHSNGEFAVAAGVEFGTYAFFDWAIYHYGGNRGSATKREFSRWAVPAISVGLSTYSSIHNFRINDHYRDQCRQLGLICDPGTAPRYPN